MPVDSMLIPVDDRLGQPLVTPVSVVAVELIDDIFFVDARTHCDFGEQDDGFYHLIGELSVALFARPALPRTFMTSGSDLIILSCTCKIRFTGVETSGSDGIKKQGTLIQGRMNSLPRLSIKGC